MNTLRSALLTLTVAIAAAPALAQKASIALLRTEPTDALRAQIQRQGDRQLVALNLLADSVTSSMPGAVNDTGKFDVVAQQDLDALLGSIEQQEVLANPSDPRVAQAFRTAGTEYAIIVRIEQFDDRVTTRGSGDDTLMRRELEMAATVSVVHIESGVLQKSLSFRPEPMLDGRKLIGGSGDGAEIGNDMVIAYGDQAGAELGLLLLEHFFPMTAIRLRGDVMSINRGEAGGIAVGDRLEIIEASEFEDPDTGEMLLEEFPVGVAEITRVSTQTSNAKVVEGDLEEIQAIIDAEDMRLLLRPMN